MKFIVAFDIDDTLTVQSCEIDPTLQKCVSTQGILLRMTELASSHAYVYMITARRKASTRGIPPLINKNLEDVDIKHFTGEERTRETVAASKVEYLRALATKHKVPYARVVLVDDNRHNCEEAIRHKFHAIRVPIQGVSEQTHDDLAKFLAKG